MLESDEPDDAEMPTQASEPDPADEERTSRPVTAQSEADTMPAPVSVSLPAPATIEAIAADEPVASIGDIENSELQEIFGAELSELIKARQPVKLDPSVDRALFRSQRDWLGKRLDYSFRAASQTWHSK